VRLGAEVIEEGADLKRRGHLLGPASCPQQHKKLPPGQLQRQQRRRRHGGIARRGPLAGIGQQFRRRRDQIHLSSIGDLHQHAGPNPPRQVIIHDRDGDHPPHRCGQQRSPHNQGAVGGEMLGQSPATRGRSRE
jgi:hypothetical protein